MPLIPASATLAISSLLSLFFQSAIPVRPSIHLSSPSGSISIAGTVDPAAVAATTIAFTVPDVGACTAAEMNPAASPICWPRRTVSPFLTVGVAGAPRCCDMETCSNVDTGIVSIDLSRLSSLLYFGWMPPCDLNRAFTIFMLIHQMFEVRWY